MKRTLFYFTIFFCITSLWAQSEQELFAQANAAYTEKDYSKAIELYEQIITDTGKQSSELHYNLGLAYEQMDSIGKAILHLEKALAINPYNQQAAERLVSIRNSAEIAEAPFNFVERFASQQPINHWIWALVICFWILVFAIVLPRYYDTSFVLVYLTRALCTVILAISLIGMTGYHFLGKRGIVIKKESQLMIAPAPGSPIGAYLTEGESASVVKNKGNYYFVKQSDGKSGWISKECFEKIWN